MLLLDKKGYTVELIISSANNWRVDFTLCGGNQFDDGEYMKRFTDTLYFPEDDYEEEYSRRMNLIKLVDSLDEVGFYISQIEPEYQETFSKITVAYLMGELPDVTDVPKWREEYEIE